jgi:tetratricopeptide (TPR) repeat protein
MASIWRCRSRVRLRHIVSNETSILFRRTFSFTFPHHRRIYLSEGSSIEQATIWQKRSELLLKAHSINNTIVKDEERPDIKLLKAAIWHDLDQIDTNENFFADKKQTDRIFRRITYLYDEMTSNGISIDNRWCKIMITTFGSILTRRSRNGDGMPYTEMLQFLQLARKIFLQVSSELDEPLFTNTAIIHSMLDLEMQVAIALIREANDDLDIDRNRINEHLRWVTEMANMMAKRRTTILPKSTFSAAEDEAYQQDLISLSSTKAGTTTINLYLLRNDYARAVEALRKLLKHSANIPKNTKVKRKAKLQHLRRVGQNYTIARGALINVLIVLCKNVRKEGRPVRSLIMEVIKLARTSTEEGLWDTMVGDQQSRSELSSRECEGPSYDFVRLCSRAISAVSPATTKNRRAKDGVRFEMIPGDEKRHQEDFFDLLKIIIDIRSSAVARELVQTLRQTTSDQPISSLEPIANPWRRSFREIFDVNREMSARIVWCLFSSWSRVEMRISKEQQKQDEEARLRTQQETELFLKRLAFILNDFMISFGMSEPSWRAVAIALRKTLHLLPSQEGRKQAMEMFEEAYEKAKSGNFGAIPSHKR